ncbi:unnamed protein product [Amaranthus hypochondriacus]
MSNYPQFLFLLSLFTIIISSTHSSSSIRNVIGEYQPIKNLEDPYVQEIAKFAITEHDKETKDHLELVKVLKGESQVVSGINYRLTVSTNDTHQYETVIFDNKRMHQRSLTSFTPVS